MNIEEKIFKDLKSAVKRKDNHEVNQLRNILHLISDHKAKVYPRVPGDFEISTMLSDNQYGWTSDNQDKKDHLPLMSDTIGKYIIPDAECELIRDFAEKIYSTTKGIYPLEEFIDKVKEVAARKQNLDLN